MCTLLMHAKPPCLPGMTPLSFPRSPSPSCFTTSHEPHVPTPLGPILMSPRPYHPKAWLGACRPHGAKVWITVRLRGHPAGNEGDECWDKENQECWTRCNCRRGCGQKVQQQSPRLQSSPPTSSWDRDHQILLLALPTPGCTQQRAQGEMQPQPSTPLH